MNILLLSMPDSFEHMPTVAIRMPNGALTSLAGNVDPHHRVAVADLILVQRRVRETIERLLREVEPNLVGLSVMTFQRHTALRIVELIRGLQTSDDTHAKAEAFAKRIGKVPITARNSPGFAVNRILCPMINEAIFALQEGIATAEEIDAGMKLGCNHPIGPLALADLIGLDTMLSVMEVFYTGFNDPKYRPAPLLKEMVDAGHLGRKSGRGFYDYGKNA